MNLRLASALGISIVAAACTGGPTNAPAGPTSYTPGQVAECQAAEDSFSASAWAGEALTTAIGGNVEQDRGDVERLIKDFLASEGSVSAPSLVRPQWAAMAAAMKADEPLFAAPMTQDQYNTTLDALWAKIGAFDTPCEAAISWGQDNLPH